MSSTRTGPPPAKGDVPAGGSSGDQVANPLFYNGLAPSGLLLWNLVLVLWFPLSFGSAYSCGSASTVLLLRFSSKSSPLAVLLTYIPDLGTTPPPYCLSRKKRPSVRLSAPAKPLQWPAPLPILHFTSLNFLF